LGAIIAIILSGYLVYILAYYNCSDYYFRQNKGTKMPNSLN
jgi:hypothetical protein